MDTRHQTDNGSVAVENQHLRAEWQAKTGIFTLIHKPTNGIFVSSGKFQGESCSARVEDITDDRLGPGKSIVMPHPDGSSHHIMLYQDIPFAFLKAVLANPETADDRVVKSIDLAKIQLNFATALSQLRALGTAGLTPPDKQPGSYVFLAVADPDTRNGVVGAWLTHDRGSGIVVPSVERSIVSIDARIDYGRLLIKPGETAITEVFALGWFQDVRLGLEEWASLVAWVYDIRLPSRRVGGYCTWYSNPHGGASDQKHLAELAEFAERELKAFGLDFIQIDDKWQDGEPRNGPAKIFCRHNPEGPYPNGMKAPADHLKSLGFTAGIWFMPFAGDRQDPFFADRQHWFVKRADGSPYFARWGGTSLDMTHPEAREYLRDVVRQMVHDWDYKYLKMDGLWVGTASELLYVNNAYKSDDLGDATFHNSEITPIEAYRSGLKLIRETAGDDVFLLGCCISQNMRSFGAAFGLVDAMRIGPDNGSSFDGLKEGAWHGSNRYFLHRRIWYNDPDPVYVRESVPLNHAQLICSWLGVTGQHLVDSDWLPELPDERLDILKRTLPPHNLTPRPVDLLEAELPRIWLLTDERGNVRRDVVGLFNWDGEKPTRVEYPADKLGLPSARVYAGFDYWANEFVPPFSGELCIHLPAGSCRVLALRVMADHPQVVSTSRHITQGILDLLSEEWNEEIGVLRGASRVAAKDPYELRIMVPAGPESWRVQGVELNNSPGGATASFQQEGQKIRVNIQSPDSGQVNWQVKFVRGLIEAKL